LDKFEPKKKEPEGEGFRPIARTIIIREQMRNHLLSYYFITAG
tara:strand:+ start:1665 stop:1793 length:129 start_codon:yes stop_codon:yes gene_type:complete